MEQTNTGVGQQSSGIDTSLEKTLERFTEAFNRFDAKAVASFWADDGTLLNPIGNYGRGRAGVEKVFGEDAKRLLGGSRSRFTVTSVRRVRDDCAFLDCEQEVQGFRNPDGSTGTMRMHLAILAQKKGDGWQWLDARPYAFMPPPRVH